MLLELVQHMPINQWRGSSSTRKTYSGSLLEKSVLGEEVYVSNNFLKIPTKCLFIGDLQIPYIYIHLTAGLITGAII